MAGTWAGRAAQAGISKLELAVAVTIIAVFSVVLLERLFYYEAQAERLQFDLAVRALQNAERMRVAHLMVRMQPVDYGRMAAENPVTWLEKGLPGYAGTAAQGKAARLGDGEWAYDGARRKMLYRPRLARGFDGLVRPDGLVFVSIALHYNRDTGQPAALELRVERAP